MNSGQGNQLNICHRDRYIDQVDRADRYMNNEKGDIDILVRLI